MMALSRSTVIVSWVCQIAVALILLQTLFFKFTGAEESKYIFTTLFGEHEALARIGSGLVELMAAILILFPRTAPIGALLALGVMAGALFSHLTKLGLVVKDDGGLLFVLALIVTACSLTVLFLRWRELPLVGGRA